MKKLQLIRESLYRIRTSHIFFLRNFSPIVENSFFYDHRNEETCLAKPPINRCSGVRSKEPARLIILSKLESTLMNHEIGESWVTFSEFNNRYGYPDGKLLTKLLTELVSSRKSLWMRKARSLAMSVSKKKPGLLGFHDLSKVALTFARAGMPEPASAMMRVFLSRKTLPPSDVLRPIFMYMLKSNVGAYLASNVLTEICGLHICTPDVLLFNLVLDGCIRFNEPIKGHLVLELMAQTDVVADAHSLAAIGHLHELNYQRDDMKSLKLVVDRVPCDLVCHYISFYDNLLSLHFKFNDFASAAEMLLDIQSSHQRIPMQILCQQPGKFFLLPIGPHNMKEGPKLRIAPHLVPREFTLKLNRQPRFICFRNGKLLPSDLAVAKIIIGFRKQGRIADLSNFIHGIQEAFKLQMGVNLCSDVINACISLGWLENAHDILDDAETAGISVTLNNYETLLASYEGRNMVKEAAALARQMKKVDLRSLKSEAKQSFISSGTLAQAIKDDKQGMHSTILELNSSIYYFCKAKMIGDAVNSYRRMQNMNVQPTLQTYAYLAKAFWSLRKLRDITFLWGDIKRSINSENLVVSRDLYEIILLCFVQGGYFERVIEVINFMRQRSMFIDKQMVRNEFLKLHRDLYKNITEAKTPAQSNRIEFVKMFRKWAGISWT